MAKEDNDFDFQEALKAIQAGKPLLGKEGILTPLIKNLTEAALEGELASHLGQEIAANRRNGKTKKTIKSLNGNFELNTPRDRAGTFSPQLVKKHQNTLTNEIESKIIALYGLGMSYKDISGHLQEMYGLEVSTGTFTLSKNGRLVPWSQFIQLSGSMPFIIKFEKTARWRVKLCTRFSA